MLKEAKASLDENKVEANRESSEIRQQSFNCKPKSCKGLGSNLHGSLIQRPYQGQKPQLFRPNPIPSP